MSGNRGRWGDIGFEDGGCSEMMARVSVRDRGDLCDRPWLECSLRLQGRLCGQLVGHVDGGFEARPE